MRNIFCALAPLVLTAAVAVTSCMITGCSDDLPEVYPAEGNAYMHDPEYQGMMKANVKRRDMLTEKLLAVGEARRKTLSEFGGDDAMARASDKWKAIDAKEKEILADLEENRTAALTLTRNRMRKAAEDSARIQRGEAKAKTISKEQEEK